MTTVVERGLVTEKPKWKEIVENHALYSTKHTAIKNFEGPTLGYVTPVGGWGWGSEVRGLFFFFGCISGITMVTTLPNGSDQSSTISLQFGSR